MNTESILESIEYSTSEKSYFPHFHNSYQILFPMVGSIELELRNSKNIIREKSLIFLSNLEKHAVRVLSTPYIGYVLYLNPKVIEHCIPDPKLLSLFKVRPAFFRNDIDVSDMFNEVHDIFIHILREASNDAPYKEDVLVQLVNYLLILLWRRHSSCFPTSMFTSNRTMYDVQVYLDKNYLEDISITDLAKQYYISASCLSRRFKEFSGFSPKQYLMLHRLMHAKNLLIHTDAQISEIAFRSGFSDINNFIKYYKKFFSENPSATRHRYIQQPEEPIQKSE